MLEIFYIMVVPRSILECTPHCGSARRVLGYLKFTRNPKILYQADKMIMGIGLLWLRLRWWSGIPGNLGPNTHSWLLKRPLLAGKSTRQRAVTCSSTEAEYYPPSTKLIRESIRLTRMGSDLGFDFKNIKVGQYGSLTTSVEWSHPRHGRTKHRYGC